MGTHSIKLDISILITKPYGSAIHLRYGHTIGRFMRRRKNEWSHRLATRATLHATWPGGHVAIANLTVARNVARVPDGAISHFCAWEVVSCARIVTAIQKLASKIADKFMRLVNHHHLNYRSSLDFWNSECGALWSSLGPKVSCSPCLMLCSLYPSWATMHYVLKGLGLY